jgi:hypothetical protein
MKSAHNLSHFWNLTGNMGNLIPLGFHEVLPGDLMKHSTSSLIRMSPLARPVMHPVNVRIHKFFCPMRLLWSGWEDFITGGSDGNDTSTPPTMTFAAGAITAGSLAHNLGLPITSTNAITVSAMPFRMAAMVYNQYYRDQNLQSEIGFTDGNGNDTTTSTTMQNICWERDPFTVMRTETQLGDEVTIPLGTTAPVESDGTQPTMTGQTSSVTGNLQFGSAEGVAISNAGSMTNNEALHFNNSGLRANLSSASAATINQLREAWSIQRYMENRLYYGSRYSDLLAARGVAPRDARLQRAQFLSGGSQTVQFSEVIQTGVDSSDAGVGNLKGHGVSALRSNAYKRYFEEHGLVMTFLSARPKTVYGQGISKFWLKDDKFDFHTPELQKMGQQPVQAQELYADAAAPAGTLGYEDCYDDYRRIESKIAGEFATTMSDWHMARIFATEPALNSAFVKCDPTDRIFQDNTIDQMQIFSNHNIKAVRPISADAAPSAI